MWNGVRCAGGPAGHYVHATAEHMWTEGHGGVVLNERPYEVDCEGPDVDMDWGDINRLEAPKLTDPNPVNTGSYYRHLNSYVQTGEQQTHLNPETANQGRGMPTGTILSGIIRTWPDLDGSILGEILDDFEVTDTGTLGSDWVISYSSGGTMPYFDYIENAVWSPFDADGNLDAPGFYPVGAISEGR